MYMVVSRKCCPVVPVLKPHKLCRAAYHTALPQHNRLCGCADCQPDAQLLYSRAYQLLHSSTWSVCPERLTAVYGCAGCADGPQVGCALPLQLSLYHPTPMPCISGLSLLPLLLFCDSLSTAFISCTVFYMSKLHTSCCWSAHVPEGLGAFTPGLGQLLGSLFWPCRVWCANPKVLVARCSACNSSTCTVQYRWWTCSV
jgi:hypothetical protein